jgi:Trk K+ transport system NAD-binding subunit
MTARPRPRIARLRTGVLYVRALVYEFRWTLTGLVAVVALGTVLYLRSPEEFDDKHPRTVLNAMFASWMAMLAQPINAPPTNWYLNLLCGVYPVIGFVLIGEGVVRLALLMSSKRRGEKEWTKVMASTYRDHVVVCGVGRLGIRVIEQLVAANVPVVGIEKEETGRFLPQARQLGVPVIVGDMKDDAVLMSAGIPHARVVIVATNDDMANLEVALDSRRMNPDIRVVMGLFDQSIASKISNAFLVDVAFSASTLAAPMVVAMSLGAKVLSSTVIAGIPHVTAEVVVDAGSELADKRVEDVERGYCCKLLARTPVDGPVQLPAESRTPLRPGDKLVVSTPGSQLTTISAAASRGTVDLAR